MNPLEAEAARQRRALLLAERRVQRELVRIYGETFRRVRHELTEVLAAIDTTASPRQAARLIAREQRLERFLLLARHELATFVLHAEPLLTALQREHVQQAIGDTFTLTDLALGTRPLGVGWEFRPPSAQVIARLIGNAGDGTPLGDVLREVAGAQVQAARTELLVGVARGKNPREIGRQMARALGQTAQRTTVIARQESLRAYREVTTATMATNPVVTGWLWSSAGDTRTCPVCWAMTGTWHPADEALASHISCRCSQVPQTKSWAELGFPDVPDTRRTIASGADRFAALAPAEQRTILGPGKHAAYISGDISLTDLVARTHSQRWGPGLRERPLRELVHA